MSAAHERVRLAPGVLVRSDAEDEFVVGEPPRVVEVEGVDPVVVAAVIALRGEATAPATLVAGFDAAQAETWAAVFTALDAAGVLAREVWLDDTLLVVVTGPTDGSDAALAAPAAVLSRFAYVRRVADALQLESPCTRAVVSLVDARAVCALDRLRAPVTRASRADDPALDAAVTALARAGVLSAVDARGEVHEATQPALRGWEFHDLLFHARSRAGRHAYPTGAVPRDQEPPARRPRPESPDALVLPATRAADRARALPTFDAVVQARASVRRYAEHAIRHDELGEFLARVARADRSSRHGPRPNYPSGGALYELTCYVGVARCDGLARGLYRYLPVRHALEPLAADGELVAALIADAARLAVVSAPQLALFITARVGDVSAKYRSIAYALVLKHVGVLMQSMYLTATALGLAPCAIGFGNADLFAEASGVDYYAESAVGEFLLGSVA